MPLTTITKIEHEAKNIATKLKLEDRITTTPHTEAYITLKGHKENFDNTPLAFATFIINPAKLQIGQISSIF